MTMEMEMSKTYQYRKVMKPMLERKRRARINKCLDDLKDLMVECLTQEGEHVTRLEKADILELTVEHMKKLKKRGSLTLNGKQLPSAPECFRSGFVHAADQISQVLTTMPGVDIQLGSKVMTFLGQKLMELQSAHYVNNMPQPYVEIPTAYSQPTHNWPTHEYSPSSCYSPDLDRSSVGSISTSNSSKESTLMWRPW